MSTPSPDCCCCGETYSARGGTSSHYCPEGKRNLCQECATNGKDQCPTHKVKIKW